MDEMMMKIKLLPEVDFVNAATATATMVREIREPSVVIQHENGLRITVVIELLDGTILTGARDNLIHQWGLHNKLKERQCHYNNNNSLWMNTFKGHQAPISCLAVVNHQMFASGSRDKTVKLWNIQSSVCLATLPVHPSGCVDPCSILSPMMNLGYAHPDADVLIIALTNCLSFWSIERQQPLCESLWVKNHNNQLQMLELTRNSREGLIACYVLLEWSEVLVYDWKKVVLASNGNTATRKPVFRIDYNLMSLVGVSELRDDRLVTFFRDGTAMIWNLKSDEGEDDVGGSKAVAEVVVRNYCNYASVVVIPLREQPSAASTPLGSFATAAMSHRPIMAHCTDNSEVYCRTFNTPYILHELSNGLLMSVSGMSGESKAEIWNMRSPTESLVYLCGLVIAKTFRPEKIGSLDGIIPKELAEMCSTLWLDIHKPTQIAPTTTTSSPLLPTNAPAPRRRPRVPPTTITAIVPTPPYGGSWLTTLFQKLWNSLSFLSRLSAFIKTR
eukprot:TRINITY_DN9883_c0_g1_i1.p1 TRINITY_DN9883_c0_g1~~TRINITY_DN9883_c0_g1_i1.p1  ORF type:complete len:501 (+),score=67.72 TRINITY_DN9883_c0_g1_i1:165-1667(+)